MVALGAHPIVTVIILFIVFFAIFFLLIYGLLQLLERRKVSKTSNMVDHSNRQGEIPTYTKSKICPRCGTSMPGVASYCPECGAPQIATQR
jgi:ribosomal protein S27AE